MKNIVKLTLGFGISAFALGAVGVMPASAQATRTWVSGVGDDVNPCSRTAPCKTFAGAISKTSAGGEINCLDPGGYGTVTITKSITIDCTGTFGSVLSSGTNGINVNDSASGFPGTIRVILRGLSINGSATAAQNAQGNPGTGLTGINFTSGSSLVVEDVIIQDVQGGAAVGISFKPSTAAKLTVSNSVIADNGTGVLVQPTGAGGSARVALNNVRVENNSNNGISVNTTGNTAAAGVSVRITNTSIDGNGTGLILLTPVGTTSAVAMLTNSDVFNSTTFGVRADGGAARIRVGNTTITGNGTGVSIANGGIVFTYGTNRLDFNTVDGAFQAPAIPQQ